MLSSGCTGWDPNIAEIAVADSIMGTWKTRGLRGSTLEDMINMTNESYREKGLALFKKYLLQ